MAAEQLPRIFVSHSTKDNGWCTPFVEELHRLGFDVWFDQKGLKAGVQWMKEIEHELEARDVFVLVITPQSWAARWVGEELQLAFNHNKTIIGVIHEATPALSGFILNRQLLRFEGVVAGEAA